MPFTNIKDLTIIIPTYNRRETLRKTLEKIKASPCSGAPLVILDNCSTDGTGEMVAGMGFPALTYIKNPYNLGLAGNLVRAMETAGKCGTEYFWIVFDDTDFDFTHWNNVEEMLRWGWDVTVVSNYYNVKFDDRAPIFLMLIYLFTGIFKTSLITPDVILYALTDIYTIHPQMALLCKVFNERRPITIAPHSVSFPQSNPETDYSFNRVPGFSHFRISSPAFFLPGFLNAVQGLKDPRLKKECIRLLFKKYHGIGPYICAHSIPAAPWKIPNFLDTLYWLPFYCKCRFLLSFFWAKSQTLLSAILKLLWRK